MKQQSKKRIKIFVCILLIWLAFAFFLGVIKGVVGIPDDIVWKSYYLISTIIIVGCIIFNMCYHMYYNKKMKEAMKLLEANETDEYIAYVNELLAKAKGSYLKTLFTINLSVGYSDKKEYKKAIALLESVSQSRMHAALKMAYRINLCWNYYYDNQREKAVSIYLESSKIFKKFRGTPLYGGNIAVLDMFMELEKENYELAAALLVIAKSKWNNPRLQDDFLYIEKILKEHTENTCRSEKSNYESVM